MSKSAITDHEVSMATKTASVIFFYFGDSYMRTLAQETVPLHLGMRGYDHCVLLKEDMSFGPFELSEAAEEAANETDHPTREALAEHLNRLGRAGYIVDLFIFSHGLDNRFVGTNGSVSGHWLEQHVDPLKLRAVWQCNCYGSTLNDTWHRLGARVTAGARGINPGSQADAS
jgi:hypothetical protein